MSDAAFNSTWYVTSCPRFRKHLVLIIKCSQEPKTFKAGGFINCDLTGFMSVSIPIPNHNYVLVIPNFAVQPLK